MLIIDLIKEYLLTTKLKIQKLLKINTPNNWAVGDKGIVILIHGFSGSNLSFLSIGNLFNNFGYKVIALKDYTSFEAVEDASKKLEMQVKSTKDEKIILVSHSKGGLVAKYFMDNSTHANRITSVVTIATPYKGSIVGSAGVLNLFELAPNSDLLNKMGKRKENNDRIFNIYPKLDNTVIPNKNLSLEGATNIQLNVVGHTRILRSNEILNEISKIITN